MITHTVSIPLQIFLECIVYHVFSIIQHVHQSNSSLPRSIQTQGSHGQGKVREKSKKFKVREKSGNFVFGQGNLKFWQKSGKSQGILESKVRPYFFSDDNYSSKSINSNDFQLLGELCYS